MSTASWYARPDTRLRTDEATKYAARLAHLRLWRVEVFGIAQGISNVELRPLPGTRPQSPAITLRTAADCEAVLAEVAKR